jgi:transcriptional regulator with XRE-family HTH domain
MQELRPSVGDLLRSWRQTRRLSQMDLALSSNISARHLSFIETGRSRPSRETVLALCEQLTLPLRECNRLMLAAGFAPIYPERALEDPSLAAVKRAIDLVLRGHEPYPALAVDRHWSIITANATLMRLIDGVAPHLQVPPVNALRLSLHPDGLAPRIVNLGEWRTHLLARLGSQINQSGDQALIALLQELKSYPAPARRGPGADLGGIAVPFRLKSEEAILSFYSTTTVFGTPLDVTVSEVALESFFPADPVTASLLQCLSG